MTQTFMVTFTEDIIDGINLALDEATILGVEFNKEEEIVAVTFSPIALESNGEVPTDNRIQLVFKSVGKFIASYRLGSWEDKAEQILKFEPVEILEKVKEFKLPIYGCEFINCDVKNDWLDKLSFDIVLEKFQDCQNTIELFQYGCNKHLDIKIWFDNFDVYNAQKERVELRTFIDNGKRGWDAILNGTASDKFGIYPVT